MSVEPEETRMAKNTNSYHVDHVVHKPSCLKQRRLSDTTTTTLLPNLPNLPKNDSLDDVSSTASCYSNYAGSLDSSLSDDSRKSVSFADSVGEDLCHVKVFSKELCEYDDEQEESWPSKLWRWQMFPTSEEGEWYVGDEDDEDDDDGRFDLNDLALVSEIDHLEDVLEEEEEDYEEEEEGEDSDTTNVNRDSFPAKKSNPNAVIVPTFLCPVDLPSFSERLAERGVSLESVSVNDGSGRITGTVTLADDINALSPIRRVCVRFSADGWASEPREAPTTAVADSVGVHYEFEIEAGGMEVGDDVEMVAVCVMQGDGNGGVEHVDDNRGLKYRFICKNRPKFQPGKSLW